jgi:carbonic anhydrase
MSAIDDIVSGNARYAAAGDLPELDRFPNKHLAVVTCMDSRIDVFAALGLELGESHVIRNAGGIVTDDVLRSLTLSQRALGTTGVAVIQHTRCGVHHLVDDQFADELEQEVGERPAFTFGGFEDIDESVRTSLRRLRTCPFLPHTDDVRGFVFDVETGELREVVDPG